jgi:hypothetical protein
MTGLLSLVADEIALVCPFEFSLAFLLDVAFQAGKVKSSFQEEKIRTHGVKWYGELHSNEKECIM